MKKWFDIVNEKVYSGMLGAEEIFSDEEFQDWVLKQSNKILEKSIKEIYKLYLKGKKK